MRIVKWLEYLKDYMYIGNAVFLVSFINKLQSNTLIVGFSTFAENGKRRRRRKRKKGKEIWRVKHITLTHIKLNRFNDRQHSINKHKNTRHKN